MPVHKNNLVTHTEQSCCTKSGVRDMGYPWHTLLLCLQVTLCVEQPGVSPILVVPTGRLVWVTHHLSDLSASKLSWVKSLIPSANCHRVIAQREANYSVPAKAGGVPSPA